MNKFSAKTITLGFHPTLMVLSGKHATDIDRSILNQCDTVPSSIGELRFYDTSQKRGHGRKYMYIYFSESADRQWTMGIQVLPPVC